MYIAFQRTIGTVSLSMVMDEDWGCLKRAMCEKWLVEADFDRHNIWDRLGDEQIVTFGNEIYQVWNSQTQGEYADELFQGRHVEVTHEVLP